MVIAVALVPSQSPFTFLTMPARGWYRFRTIAVALFAILFVNNIVDGFHLLQPRITSSRCAHPSGSIRIQSLSKRFTVGHSQVSLFATPKSSSNRETEEIDDDDQNDDEDDEGSWAFEPNPAADADMGLRETDFGQNRDLDLILTERAERFYDPKLVGVEKEKCILVAVDTKLEERRTALSIKMGSDSGPVFSLQESLQELSELVGTAGLQVGAVLSRHRRVIIASSSRLVSHRCTLFQTVSRRPTSLFTSPHSCYTHISYFDFFYFSCR
jgi:hypothetical protein